MHYLYIIVHIKPCYVCSLFMVLLHLLGGYLFAWGDNRNGQLGIGNSSLVHNLPEHVSSLVGVPFALLCAGGYHSFALSLSGALFSWGRNKYVCLADSTFVVMVVWPGNAVQVFTQNSLNEFCFCVLYSQTLNLGLNTCNSILALETPPPQNFQQLSWEYC